MKKPAVLVLIALILLGRPFAGITEEDIAIVHLKTGGEVSGVIVEQTEEGIILDAGYGTVGISHSQIVRVKRPAEKEKAGMIESWRRKRSLVLEAGKTKAKKRELERFYRRMDENRKITEEIAKLKRKATEHRIALADSSKIFADVVLNDQVEAKMLVDTGADLVLIPLSVAEGLEGIEIDRSGSVKTKLADGTEREGIPITLDSVRIGEIEAVDIKAITMEMKGDTGLLGMSFLKNFHIRIDSENNELVIRGK